MMITDSEYRKMLEEIVASGMTEVERGDILIRSMCKAIDYILNYRYVKEHYNGDNEKVMSDQANRVTEMIIVTVSDIDLYLVSLKTINHTEQKAKKRINGLWNKVVNIEKT